MGNPNKEVNPESDLPRSLSEIMPDYLFTKGDPQEQLEAVNDGLVRTQKNIESDVDIAVKKAAANARRELDGMGKGALHENHATVNPQEDPDRVALGADLRPVSDQDPEEPLEPEKDIKDL